MKIKLLLLISMVFIGFIVMTTSNVVASHYDIGVRKGDSFTWKCNICDDKKMEDLFGKNWNSNGTGLFEDLKRGNRMKLTVKDTDKDFKIYNPSSQENEEFLSIIFRKWIWTNDDKWGDYDYKDQITHYSDPKDYSDDLIFPNCAPIWLPLPLDDYLKEIDLYEGYSIDTRSRLITAISCEVKKYDLKGKYPTEYINIHAIYNDRGILKSYKLYIENHQIIIEIVLESNSIPPMIEFFIPVILVIFYLGIIYLMYKKVLID